MKFVRRVLHVLVAVLAATAGVFFAIGNWDPVIISFLGWSTGTMPLAFWVGIVFVSGILIGITVVSPRLIRMSVARTRLEKELGRRESESQPETHSSDIGQSSVPMPKSIPP